MGMQGLEKIVATLFPLREPPADGPNHMGTDQSQTIQDLSLVGKDQLRRSGGRRGAQVGGQVAQRLVDLVPHAAHDWDWAGTHGADHAFVVEGDQVLPAPSTAHQQDAIQPFQKCGT